MKLSQAVVYIDKKGQAHAAIVTNIHEETERVDLAVFQKGKLVFMEDIPPYSTSKYYVGHGWKKA